MVVAQAATKAALQSTKPNNAAGTDGIYPKMLKNVVPKNIPFTVPQSGVPKPGGMYPPII